MSAGKNNATAIAATAFSPLVAVPAVTMPIFQVVLMVAFLRLAPRVRAYDDRRPSPARVTGAGAPQTASVAVAQNLDPQSRAAEPYEREKP